MPKFQVGDTVTVDGRPAHVVWLRENANEIEAMDEYIVEFDDKVTARAVTAGGESGDPKSPHFNDQATRYASGDLREVYFYPAQLKGHTERTYHPGQ